jgi:hypothetical protein
MYKAKFINSKGQTFFFGYEHQNLFDIDGLTGQDISISASQGFNQIGETVENLSVGGRLFEISGRFLGEATEQKKKMLSVFAPFESGRLVFEEKYFIECVVKYTPIITIEKKNPRFNVILSASYPFWQKITQESYITGSFVPNFRFPVNYSEPHSFGVPVSGALLNVYNGGEVEAYFRIDIMSRGETLNPGILNVKTQEFLKLNAKVVAGEKYSVYRKKGKLVVEKETEGIVEDVFSLLDEDSDLFALHVGDNVISAFAEENESLLTVAITFNNAVVGVYEGI